MDKARVIGIWVSGVIASALIGIGFGGALAGFSGMSPDNVAPPIALGSIALFACFRLWRVEIRNNG
jgi:hypothetical protein